MGMIGNRLVRKLSAKCLVWLGFAATPFIFMACYGSVPRDYGEVAFDEEVVDSTALDEDVAEVTDSADMSVSAESADQN